MNTEIVDESVISEAGTTDREARYFDGWSAAVPPPTSVCCSACRLSVLGICLTERPAIQTSILRSLKARLSR
jgi:hypothetical protein